MVCRPVRVIAERLVERAGERHFLLATEDESGGDEVVLTQRDVRELQFAKAAIERGHEIQRVFFYHDGVYNATRLTEPPQDDRHIVNRWSALKEQHGVDLVVCVAAALRRPIIARRSRSSFPAIMRRGS